MLSRENFIFTIGYDGDSALVDGRAKKRFGRLSSLELAEQGLFRAAWASAVHADKPEEKKAVIDAYNRVAGTNYTPESHVGRLFGVHRIDISRAKFI